MTLKVQLLNMQIKLVKLKLFMLCLQKTHLEHNDRERLKLQECENNIYANALTL